MTDELATRALHLHTIESLCADLVSGRAIGVGTENAEFRFDDDASRSTLEWYRLNRDKWTGNVKSADIESIVDSVTTEPPSHPVNALNSAADKRTLRLAKIEAHRFGGLCAYGTADDAPEHFVFVPKQPVTLFEGWNGSGKTSILNAVIWCLTGQLLRPQRKPESAGIEFEYRVDRNSADSVEEQTLHKLTPITPIPNPDSYLPPTDEKRVPVDTWVELTFEDESGSALAPVRRTQSRSARGAISETEPSLGQLGIDPIAAHVGTTMPGLIPFIQIGTVSELGTAVTELTGLAELVELSKHAEKVKQRLDGKLRKEREEEIAKEDEKFLTARGDLETQIKDHPSIQPLHELPKPSADPELETVLLELVEHFSECQDQALASAKAILGESFDSSDQNARDDLVANIGAARGQLGRLGDLKSAARLQALGRLSSDQVDDAETLLGEFLEQARVLDELAANPALSRRKQLYARVAGWMKEHEKCDLTNCVVCGSDLDNAIDEETETLVADHLKEAFESDSGLISHSVESWSQASIGKMNQSLPEIFSAEIKRDLPEFPTDLVKEAICVELFNTEPFLGALASLKSNATELCNDHLDCLPAFDDVSDIDFPTEIARQAFAFHRALQRLARAIAFARWRSVFSEAFTSGVKAIIGAKTEDIKAVERDSPLGAQLDALDEIVKNATPISVALKLCERMSNALETRRDKEARISAYEVSIEALTQIIALGDLAEQQVTDLRGTLEERAIFWRNRFYSNAYSSAGHDLLDTDLDSKGALKFFAGSNGASAPVQHIANASALRSSLLGFFVAFWEHLLTVRGGLKLIVFDDPQELLDDDNRDRLARALNELAGSGAQIIVTTHDRSFARLTVAEGRKRTGVEHRSVHPVNAARNTVETAPAIEELDSKRSRFEREIDDAVAAQDYISEARIFIEARLADLFDDPSYPAFSTTSKAPTLSDHLSRLRGLVSSPPNDLFGRRSFTDFARDPALQDGAACMTALNTSHHNKSSITYRQVSDVQDDLKRLRSVEKLHEEFRGWRWRDPDPDVAVENTPLAAVLKPTFDVKILPDLAAFTGSALSSSSQEVDTNRFRGEWFEDKALYYIRNENLGFAAPSGSIVVVECDPKPGNDRNLVIAVKGERIYARRLLRAMTSNSSVALSAQTADPRKSPPTILIDPSKVQIHRVLGVLFDDIPPPTSKEEAVLIDEAPSLERVEAAYLVRDESALPLALPRQLVLGGPLVEPNQLAANEQRLVAITLTDGTSIFKRVGPSLPGSMAPLRLFESIGGLGASEVVATEEIEGQFDGLPVMAYARLVVGVLYEH